MESSDDSVEPEAARQAYQAARAAWPDVQLGFDAFASHMRGAGPHATDLYLACACAAGDPAALAAFDRLYVVAVREALARIDRSHDFVGEVQQILRERLLVGPHAKIRDYRGNGALASWVRTAAVRTALNLRRGNRPELRDDADHEPLAQLYDPEIVLLRQRYLPDIDAALRQAIAALPARDRLVLQLYYIDGLTLAKIAALEGVGTSTIFRRMSAATQGVLTRMKAELAGRLQVSSDSLDSLIRHVQDDIDLSLSQVL